MSDVNSDLRLHVKELLAEFFLQNVLMCLGHSHTDFWRYGYSLSLIGRISIFNTGSLEMVMTITLFTKLLHAIQWASIWPSFLSGKAQVIWRWIYPSLLVSHRPLALSLAHCDSPTNPLEKEFRFFRGAWWKRCCSVMKWTGIFSDRDSSGSRITILFAWLGTLLASSFWCVT